MDVGGMDVPCELKCTGKRKHISRYSKRSFQGIIMSNTVMCKCT